MHACAIGGVWPARKAAGASEPAASEEHSVLHARQAEAGSEEYGGARPFSEPEARVVRLVAETARPQAYVALHSGEYALYVPWDSEARPARGRPTPDHQRSMG